MCLLCCCWGCSPGNVNNRQDEYYRILVCCVSKNVLVGVTWLLGLRLFYDAILIGGLFYISCYLLSIPSFLTIFLFVFAVILQKLKQRMLYFVFSFVMLFVTVCNGFILGVSIYSIVTSKGYFYTYVQNKIESKSWYSDEDMLVDEKSYGSTHIVFLVLAIVEIVSVLHDFVILLMSFRSLEYIRKFPKGHFGDTEVAPASYRRHSHHNDNIIIPTNVAGKIKFQMEGVPALELNNDNLSFNEAPVSRYTKRKDSVPLEKQVIPPIMPSSSSQITEGSSTGYPMTPTPTPDSVTQTDLPGRAYPQQVIPTLSQQVQAGRYVNQGQGEPSMPSTQTNLAPDTYPRQFPDDGPAFVKADFVSPFHDGNDSKKVAYNLYDQQQESQNEKPGISSEPINPEVLELMSPFSASTRREVAATAEPELTRTPESVTETKAVFVRSPRQQQQQSPPPYSPSPVLSTTAAIPVPKKRSFDVRDHVTNYDEIVTYEIDGTGQEEANSRTESIGNESDVAHAAVTEPVVQFWKKESMKRVNDYPRKTSMLSFDSVYSVTVGEVKTPAMLDPSRASGPVPADDTTTAPVQGHLFSADYIAALINNPTPTDEKEENLQGFPSTSTDGSKFNQNVYELNPVEESEQPKLPEHKKERKVRRKSTKVMELKTQKTSFELPSSASEWSQSTDDEEGYDKLREEHKSAVDETNRNAVHGWDTTEATAKERPLTLFTSIPLTDPHSTVSSKSSSKIAFNQHYQPSPSSTPSRGRNFSIDSISLSNSKTPLSPHPINTPSISRFSVDSVSTTDSKIAYNSHYQPSPGNSISKNNKKTLEHHPSSVVAPKSRILLAEQNFSDTDSSFSE